MHHLLGPFATSLSLQPCRDRAAQGKGDIFAIKITSKPLQNISFPVNGSFAKLPGHWSTFTINRPGANQLSRRRQIR